ncbi:hypothetical protein ACI3KS_07240 [Microbacterium sp. ZW T5_45]|uniref:hypothetical protein n=1 Tax=Microbacterium sp. ZW T5_45 TaxID=3378080 RepID=UPI003854CAFA
MPGTVQYADAVIVGEHTHSWYELKLPPLEAASVRVVPSGTGVVSIHSSARARASASAGEIVDIASGLGDGAAASSSVVAAGAAIDPDAQPTRTVAATATPMIQIPP